MPYSDLAEPGRSSWWPIVAFAALALVLRLPFFFVDVIDWDESTFILMGQSWAEGDLPYTKLWDNKPPLCFAPFALSALVFGKSIVAIRTIGFICVVATATIVWRTVYRLESHQAGLIGGFSAVVLATFASRGQATMSETIAMVPLALAASHMMLADTERIESRRRFAIAGVAFALAALVRLNLGLVGVVALIYGLRRFSRNGGLAMAAGAAVPVVLVAISYASAGQLGLAWRSAVIAPFVYALAGLGGFANPAASELQTSPMLGAFFRPRLLPPAFWWLAVATAVSILLSGGGAAHYWIQIHPFTSFGLGVLLARAFARFVPRVRGASLSLFLLVPIAAQLSDASLLEAYRQMSFSVQGRTLKVSDYLRAHQAETVFLLSDHLAYWWLELEPPHPMATHPSNLFRPYLVEAVTGESSAAVIEEILDGGPQYIVRTEHVRHLDKVPAAAARLRDVLVHDYALEQTIDGTRIYRLQRPSP